MHECLTVICHEKVIAPLTASSQPCLPEGITFSTQEQIDNFQNNYPDCTQIVGDVRIGFYFWTTYDITNLNGLSCLTSIGVSPISTIEIYNNATGCNSQTEVEETCAMVAIDEIVIYNQICKKVLHHKSVH